MAVTYNIGVDEAVTSIGGSTLPDAVKSAIIGVLESLPEGEEVGVAKNYNSGDNLPPGIDILFFDENASQQIRLPSDVPVAIFETETGRTITVDGYLPVVVAAGNGDDYIDASRALGNVGRVLDGGAGNDTIVGSNFRDTFVDNAGDDLYIGGRGNDTFYLGSGSDTVQAGGGFDVVNFVDFTNDVEERGSIRLRDGDHSERRGFDEESRALFRHLDRGHDNNHGNDNSSKLKLDSRENYSLEWHGKTAIVVNLETQDVVEIKDAEVLRWSDAIVFQIGPIHVELGGPVLRLYEALFNRGADTDGAKFWYDLYNKGNSSLHDIAGQLLNDPGASEVRSLSNGEFVDQLYLNTLDREADAHGREYWVNLLEETGDRAQIAASFVSEHEKGDKTADVIHIITDEDDDLQS